MADYDTFYSAQGKAIARWADVELALFKVYLEIMRPQLWVVTSATYHVPQT